MEKKKLATCIVHVKPSYRVNIGAKPEDYVTMSKESITFDVGRDSETGRFITVDEAEAHPKTTTVERIPKPGRGDTRNEPKHRPSK